MSPQRAAEIDEHLVNFRAVMAQAKADALNPGAVEQRLSNLNKAKAWSAGWYLELAQRLLHVASDLAAEGKARPVRGGPCKTLITRRRWP